MTDDEQWWPEQEGDGPHPLPLFHAARRYLWNGWYPIPVARATKKPTLPNWPLVAAKMTYEGVEALWNRDDPPNIGLVTGLRYDVLDIDGPVGQESIDRALGTQRFRPTGPVARTGGGGYHIYFATTGFPSRTGILPKVDFRGVAGQVVAPPSIHANGTPYRWMKNNDWELALPPAPDWLIALLEMQVIPSLAITGIHADHGSVADTLSELGIPSRREGGRVVFSCQSGRHNDSDWSAKTHPSREPDNWWLCFGCGATGDAQNLRDGTHVVDGQRHHNMTLAS